MSAKVDRTESYEDRYVRGVYIGCPVCLREVLNSCYHDGQDIETVYLNLPVPPQPEHVFAQDGWDHVACTTCGYVTTVPMLAPELGPWCPHNGSAYMWREPVEKDRWTQMVRVDVITRVP